MRVHLSPILKDPTSRATNCKLAIEACERYHREIGRGGFSTWLAQLVASPTIRASSQPGYCLPTGWVFVFGASCGKQSLGRFSERSRES
jgi:hypothetical protein